MSSDNQEFIANNLISDLILNINLLTKRKDPLIKCVKFPRTLIAALRELQNLVEMSDIKKSIVKQIKFLICNNSRIKNVSSEHFEGHMLHTVISGNPGTGKTTVSKILAKIWMALGFVTKKSQLTTSKSDLLKQLESEKLKHAVHSTRMNKSLKDCVKKSSFLQKNATKLRSKKNSKDKSWEIFIRETRDLRYDLEKISQDILPTTSPFLETDDEDLVPNFVVATRKDFVGEFVGQTAIKTTKILESARGGVLFIDEAYSLCYLDKGSKDKFGEECLTVINEFMSLYPDEIIIIFAGYKDMLMSTIFKAQPGLHRRCSYFFEIKDYSINGLNKIFLKLLEKDSWILDPSVNMTSLLSQNQDLLKYGGGFAEKLAFFCKIEYGSLKFQETINNQSVNNSVVTLDIIENSLVQLRQTLTGSIEHSPLPMFI